tara:strand:+ start:2054 stop:2182 length:129 start_codon:yes stop_codon:yes gene_type:complete
MRPIAKSHIIELKQTMFNIRQISLLPERSFVTKDRAEPVFQK